MSRLLYRIGHLGGRHPWRLIAVWLLGAVAVVGLNSAIGGESDDSFRLPGAESQRAADELIARFPSQTVHASPVVFHLAGGLTDPAPSQAVRAALAGLGAVPHVVAVTDPFASPGVTLSADRETAYSTVAFDVEEITRAEYDAAEKATAVARDAGVQVEYGGMLALAKGEEKSGGEIIGVGVAVLVLVIAFGSLVAMSIPIVVALLALLIGTSLIGVLAGALTVPSVTLIVATMLGLGVGIDYALFVLARYRQNLLEDMPVPEAIGRANAAAGLSVLCAGVTVILAIAGLQVAGIPMLTMMGWGAALMISVTMLAAITLLPGVLGVAGRRINSLRIPFGKPATASDVVRPSSRWARLVVDHPIRFGGAAALVLGLLALPVLSLRIGFSDAGNAAPTSTARRSYDLLADGFGPGSNGQLEVAVELKRAGGSGAGLLQIEHALAEDADIVSVSPAVLDDAKDLAVIVVTPRTAPQDAATAHLVDRLRDDLLPAATAGTGLTATVTGGTAFQVDISERLQSRMLWFMGAVIALSFVVLMLLFRSVLLPLKAAALNLISIGAAYGVVVAVFQWGWGASLIGIEETVPINPLAPMLMFSILFGLSMDYEVFLLSRMRERYLAHRDPARAVVEGVGSTARVITSAGLIMISVFGSFILSSDSTAKLYGVGLSVAVLLDVTLVRMVLVPAAMSLMGHRAWWLPGWLERVLPTVDPERGLSAVPSDETDGTRECPSDRDVATSSVGQL